MHLVTGGAGFIGSNIVAELLARGDGNVVVCDRFGTDEKWRNLAKHELAGIVAPERLDAWLEERGGEIRSVLHMGAISATTERDVDLIVETNVRLTLRLLDFCTTREIPFLYASSAATYGDGGAGFDDDATPDALARLRPLNAYGWSKHLVDRRIARMRAEGTPLPPQCVGLKFFNVYGPNEYHKGTMHSVVYQTFRRLAEGLPARLFRSHHPDFADGEQLRDFVHVDDCVRLLLWFLDHPEKSGLYNCGTGKARTFLSLAEAVHDALGLPTEIEWADTPIEIRDRYQYRTEASMDRVREIGYPHDFLELEEGVDRYVKGFLGTDDPWR